MLILAASVLLVRLDLVRIRLAPAPGLLALLLAGVVLVGANLGHRLGTAHTSDNEGIAPAATGQQAQPQVSNRRRLLLGRVKTQQQPAPQAR